MGPWPEEGQGCAERRLAGEWWVLEPPACSAGRGQRRPEGRGQAGRKACEGCCREVPHAGRAAGALSCDAEVAACIGCCVAERHALRVHAGELVVGAAAGLPAAGLALAHAEGAAGAGAHVAPARRAAHVRCAGDFRGCRGSGCLALPAACPPACSSWEAYEARVLHPEQQAGPQAARARQAAAAGWAHMSASTASPTT